MALIIEDGSGVANANSYITLAEARAYASDRGVVLPSFDSELTPMLIKAADFIESKQARFVGKPADVDQAMSWPRKNVLKSDGTAFPSNEIPVALKAAQCQCVIEQNNGIALMPTTDNTEGYIIREKIDVLETQYSDKIVRGSQPDMPAVDALLNGLLRTVAALSVVRV